MRGCFKFDENPAMVSLRADLASYWICSLVRAKVSRMYGSEYGTFYTRRRNDENMSDFEFSTLATYSPIFTDSRS